MEGQEGEIEAEEMQYCFGFDGRDGVVSDFVPCMRYPQVSLCPSIALRLNEHMGSSLKKLDENSYGIYTVKTTCTYTQRPSIM